MSHIPDRDCSLCPRLARFRKEQRQAHPDWHNAPVNGLGSMRASLLVVGLAPGLKGANMSGLPFSGDGSGDLLYANLATHGFARGPYLDHSARDMDLFDCRVSNAVRCVPPENRPVAAEINACLPYLASEIAAMPRLKAILCLGSVAHKSVLKSMELPQSALKFAHAASLRTKRGITLYDSYHCSRYNLNTGRLTPDMFESLFIEIRRGLDGL